MKASEEVGGAAIVASGDMPKMLELVEEPLDAITEPVGQGVMRDGDLAPRSRWNDGFGTSLGDEVAQGVSIIGFVGDDAASRQAREQLWCGEDVVRLATGQEESQGATLSIGDNMDFGGQSSPGTPQSLIAVPPFPVAACWWARTKGGVEHEILVVWIAGEAVEH